MTETVVRPDPQVSHIAQFNDELDNSKSGLVTEIQNKIFRDSTLER